MVFEDLEVRLAVVRDCPERVVVVGQRGEEDAEEETCRWRELAKGILRELRLEGRGKGCAGGDGCGAIARVG